MVEEIARVDELLRLRCDGSGDRRMVVAECADADAGEQIEVLGVVGVVEVHAFAARKQQRVARIGVEHQLGFRGLQLIECVVHATMTSVPSLMRVLAKSGRTAAASAGRMRTRLTPWMSASLQALSLGSMPPETTEAFSSAGTCASESQRMTEPSAPFTPGTSVRKTSASALVAMAQAAAISSALML